MIKEWLNNLLVRFIAIFSAFSIRSNKVKKTLEFSLLKTMKIGDRRSISSVLILFKPSLSRLLFGLNFVFSKLAIY